ncbi:hypothetical protein CH75_08185 [Dyella jiangningensis]|jgi:hypothetical protein|uniref:DUF2934 domain-containing protein n=1 Tax=Dyella jiangningensis TaxID=1379159 RepID=UPI0004567B5C|nr:DUF2934 domain-containing protein [Dyella jiangningensis]AHX13213.1 hypothetical protein CH75_08185 [Dyella jiangningensis]MDG2538870.1 DUF2934 domain-containing protein [Dyella jiangningensis]
MNSTTDHDERVRQMAHRIWESEGRPHGQDERHWHMAERLVEANERAVFEAENGEPPHEPEA